MNKKFALVFYIVLFSFCTQFVSGQNKRTAIVPKWAFGHIVWEDNRNTQEAALELVSLYKKHQIPVSGIIIDSPWSESYNDFNWDKARYPEPDKMLESFEDEQVKVILWLTGCVNYESADVPVKRSPDYDYVIRKKYVVNNGKPSTWWKGKGVHIDFTNPEAVKWWYKKLDKVFRKNVYGFKVDQGEQYFGNFENDEDEKKGEGFITTSIGKIPLREFKKYYYDAMYDYVKTRNPAGITLARPFTHQGGFAAAIDKLGLGWCGDFSGNYKGLKLQINNIYTSAKEGYGALACEVGGFFRAPPTKEQLIRYAQFGAMTACMINGGQNGAFTNHLPWYHDEETTSIYRYYVLLHNMLSPYMFSTIVDAHLHGGSLLKNVSLKQESHLLGNDIFFKAITSDTSKVAFRLPLRNNWIDFWTGKRYEGGSQITKEYSLKQAPLFIRAGAIIPVEINTDKPVVGNRLMKGKTAFLIYPSTQENTLIYHRPIDEGIAYRDIEIVCNDKTIRVDSGSKEDFVFLIKSQQAPKNIAGADNWAYNSDKKTIEIYKKGKKFKIKIE
ncbi:MAG: hypothetical protein DSY82_00325 [Flavobacteriia bacterium]|nr:MAG: hypothetical protein DSY82_00325 [Flavobacteriia bacterium]